LKLTILRCKRCEESKMQDARWVKRWVPNYACLVQVTCLSSPSPPRIRKEEQQEVRGRTHYFSLYTTSFTISPIPTYSQLRDVIPSNDSIFLLSCFPACDLGQALKIPGKCIQVQVQVLLLAALISIRSTHANKLI